MIILGVTFLSDVSAAVRRDGGLVDAVTGECLSRVKLWSGTLRGVITKAPELSRISMQDVDLIGSNLKHKQHNSSVHLAECATVYAAT